MTAKRPTPNPGSAFSRRLMFQSLTREESYRLPNNARMTAIEQRVVSIEANGRAILHAVEKACAALHGDGRSCRCHAAAALKAQGILAKIGRHGHTPKSLILRTYGVVASDRGWKPST